MQFVFCFAYFNILAIPVFSCKGAIYPTLPLCDYSVIMVVYDLHFLTCLKHFTKQN